MEELETLRHMRAGEHFYLAQFTLNGLETEKHLWALSVEEALEKTKAEFRDASDIAINILSCGWMCVYGRAR